MLQVYKKISVALLLGASSLNVMAGGMFSNNNQNPVFFRQPAQQAVVGIQGAYYDPAGVAMMNNGWHLGVGDMMAFQTRRVTSEYAPFAMNASNPGSSVREFKGSTFSPLIPSLDLAYVHDRWAASFHFGVVSGGGHCTFDKGLGSFEAPIALLPGAVNMLTGSQMFSAYEADIHFTGENFAFGGQLNFAYKIIDTEKHKLSVSAGVRLNYIQNTYTGGIFDYNLFQGGNKISAVTALKPVLMGLGLPEPQAAAYAAQLGGDKEVDCKQKAWAVNPIISAHYATGAWDFAVKYEFVTKVNLKNDTRINTAGIAQFNDGAGVAGDMPSILTAGFSVDILKNLRGAAGMNVYFDKYADYNGRQEKLGSNTFEFNIGAEYDINSKWTVSLGSQITRFDFGENNDYLTDMSFSLPSWCLGGGFRYHFTDRIAIDVSAFNTFYEKASKKYTDYGNAGATYAGVLSGLGIPQEMISKLYLPGTDEFFRTSFTWGIGLVWDF